MAEGISGRTRRRLVGAAQPRLGMEKRKFETCCYSATIVRSYKDERSSKGTNIRRKYLRNSCYLLWVVSCE